MKLLAAIVCAGALWALPARAACEPDGVVVFPRSGAVLPINSSFILEGRGTFATRVEALVGKQLRLVSEGGEDVLLDVRKGWQSERARTAVRLVPRGKLRPEARYRLQLEALLPGAKNLDEEGADAYVWRTGARADGQRPKWEKLPGPSEGRYVMDGGAITKELKLNMSLEDESPLYVVINLRRARGSEPAQTYFAPVYSQQVTIGHDGCSGSFTFEDGRAYFARFEVFDAAGNKAAGIKPIELHAPRPVRR